MEVLLGGDLGADRVRAVACEDDGDAIASVGGGADGLARSATAQVQPGLDVWRPHRRSRAVLRVVEFMTAAPAARGAHHPSEYTASGPATRELRQLGGGATVRRI